MTKEEVKRLLENSDEAVKIGLVAIYHRQTLDEQTFQQTNYQNSIGFNSVDADFLSSLAKQVEVCNYLSESQMGYARQRMLKYSGQLAGMGLLNDIKVEEKPKEPKLTLVKTQSKPVLTIEVRKAEKIFRETKMSLFVSFPYSPDSVNKIKSLRTRCYNPDTKAWEVPVSAYSTILELFSHMEIKAPKDMPVEAPAKEEIQKEIDTNFPDGFSFKTNPFNHQLDGIKYGLKNNSWLLGDEQGLGKTKQVIDLAVMRKMRGEINHCIIICGVNGLKYNWKREVELHSNEECYIIGTRVNSRGELSEGSVQDRIDSLAADRKEFFLIINIESLRNEDIVKLINKKAATSMIAVDEFHRCANPTSQQAKGLLKLQAQYKVAMTGTPILNKPLDLYSIMKWLRVEASSFFQFKNRYCVFGGYGGYEITGYKNMTELQKRVEKIMLRRLKKDVLNLPEKIRQFEYVEMGAKQKQLYKEVVSFIKEHIDQIALDPNPLAHLIRLRQVTAAPELISTTLSESAKLDRMVELIEEIIANNQKVVIFSQWAEVIKAAQKRLDKFAPSIIMGETPVVERQNIVNQFQNNRLPHVLLGTTGAMGTGLTLTAASTAIFLDLPWTESALAQAEDRLHRIGTSGTVNIICLTCKNSVDEKIIKIVQDKKDIADALIDGALEKLDKKKLIEFLVD